MTVSVRFGLGEMIERSGSWVAGMNLDSFSLVASLAETVQREWIGISEELVGASVFDFDVFP